MKSPFRKVLLVAVCTGIFVFLYKYATISIPLSHVVLSYCYPFLDFISVVLGPIIGGVVGFFGTMLVSSQITFYSVLESLLTMIDCVILGILCRKIDVKNGFFGRLELFTFLKATVFSNFFCYVVLRTAVYCLYSGNWNMPFAFFRRVLSPGMWIWLIDSLLSMIVTSLLLVLYARTRISEANFYRS